MSRTILFAVLLILGLSTMAMSAEPVRLTDDGRLKFSPTIDWKQKAILYAELEKPTLLRLMRLDLETKKVEPLHAKASTSEFEPYWARSSSQYVFLRLKGPLSVAVCIRNSESGEELEIPPAEGFSGLRSPAISSDGKRVAFNFPDGGGQRLISIGADGRGRKELADAGSFNNWPDFSPDGKEIVFSSTRDGNFEIYTMPVEGGTAKRLTKSPFQDIRPRYSPEGKRIAFVSHRDGNAEIYVMNRDGEDVRRWTDHPERDDYPAWHPDGKHLAAVCERDGQFDVYLLASPMSD